MAFSRREKYSSWIQKEGDIGDSIIKIAFHEIFLKIKRMKIIHGGKNARILNKKRKQDLIILW